MLNELAGHHGINSQREIFAIQVFDLGKDEIRQHADLTGHDCNEIPKKHDKIRTFSCTI